MAQKSVLAQSRTFNPRAKKPPRCISAGGGSVLIAQRFTSGGLSPCDPVRMHNGVGFRCALYSSPFLFINSFSSRLEMLAWSDLS